MNKGSPTTWYRDGHPYSGRYDAMTGKLATIGTIVFVLLSMHLCGCAKESNMEATLKTEVMNSIISSGDAIDVRLTLTNTGSQPLQLPSLSENNIITSYRLEDEDGTPIGTYNHVSRQIMLEFQRVRYTDQEMTTLAPGEKTTRDYNLLLLHWLDTPGKYGIRGIYKWENEEILSDPAMFEIIPADISAYDQQWCYNYGEKFYLHAAAVIRKEDNYCMILRQSERFRPTVVDFNREVYRQDQAFRPVLSFNRSFMAENTVWIAWISDSRLFWLPTDSGKATGAAHSVDIQLDGARIIAPTALNGDKTATVVLSGKHNGESGILIAKLDDAGNMVSSNFAAKVCEQTDWARCLCDESGNFHLLWVENKGGISQLSILDLDMDTATATSEATTLWETGGTLLGVVTPSLLRDNDRAVYCAVQAATDDNLLTLTRVPLEGGEPSSRINTVTPHWEAAVTSFSGERDEDGAIHCAIADDSGDIFYVDFNGGRVADIATGISPKTPPQAHLFINDRNDVFVGFNHPSKGFDWLQVREAGESEIEMEDDENAQMDEP
jgi:hypothetical protein